MLKLLDILLTCMHLILIVFNLIGWAWHRTRKVHLIAVMLTFVSWFLLGIWYGWGYCFLTDWHWNVKRRLGETDLPNSFIKYAGDHITGLDLDATLVDMVTALMFFAMIAVTMYVNYRQSRVSR
jgi:hypothetical protein